MKKLSQTFSQWLLTIFLLAGVQFTAASQTATHLHFDGVNDFVNLPVSSLFDFGTGDFTTEAWIRTTSNNLQIVAGASGAGDFWLGTSSGKAAFSISGSPLVGSTAINDNQWHHIAGVRLSGTIHIYVDGVLDGSLANNLSFITGGQPLTVGRFNGGFGGYYFTGEIEEVRIWNAAQTAGNIAARRNIELVGNETGLLAYYKFNQGIAGGNNTAITTLTNSTANPLNGIITNFALTGSTSNFLSGSPVPQQGTHLNFDGVNDFVNIPSTSISAILSGTTALTVEAWVKSTIADYTGVNIYNTGSILANHRPFGATQFSLRPNGTKYEFFVGVGAYIVQSPANAITPGTWQHIAGVFNGSTIKLYINGVLVGTTNTPGYSLPASAEAVTIGNSGYGEQFNGSIDDVRIWNSILSVDDIARRKNCELQGNEAGLYAYYKFNQGFAAGTNTTVTTLNNSTAIAGLNGTLTNMALTGNTSNWLSGSAVTTGSTIPAAPSAAAQSFCGSGTVADLVPAPSATINWYNVATGGTALTGTTALATGTYYVAAANTNGCESARTAAGITVIATTLAGVNQNSTLSVTSTTNFPGCANLIAKLSPNGASPVNGNTTAKVWIEGTQNPQFVKRHYEITPALNAATATGRITLYFTQAEFDDFNAVNTSKLPTGAADVSGKANLLIEKRSGVSGDGSGLPGTYTGTVVTIDPVDADILWNVTANRWEVSFDVTGFSGFFVKTINAPLPLNLLAFSGSMQSNSEVMLHWQTTNEINSTHFEIEVSSNGNSFVKLGTVAAKNTNGINNYQFADNSNWTSDIRYYRLKLSDNDGRFKYSSVIRLSNKQQSDISIYPNPVKDVFTLQVSGNKLLHTRAQLVDISGKLIKSITINNLFQIIDISLLAKGMYLLKFEDGSVNKIIKE